MKEQQYWRLVLIMCDDNLDSQNSWCIDSFLALLQGLELFLNSLGSSKNQPKIMLKNQIYLEKVHILTIHSCNIKTEYLEKY